MERFTHSPLDVTRAEFRLLELSPLPLDADLEDDTLHCTITHASLSDASRPEYETISYCWGDPTPCKLIHVNGQSLMVPENTYQTLKALSLPLRPRTVWIDACCVNQSDNTERAQQVPLMRIIYRRSCGNLINLGKEDESTLRAIEDITAIAREVRDETNDLETLKETIQPNNRWANASNPMRTKFDAEALIKFFSRPWFRRVWVIQEALLAPRNASACGRLQVEFLDVLRVAAWLYHYHAHHIPRSLYDVPGLRNASMMWDHTIVEHMMPAFFAFSEACYFEASEQRDKVFGMLGLLIGSERTIPALLMPDYGKETAKIFRDATRFAIEEVSHFHMLRYVFHRSEEELSAQGFPSWALRFDIRPGRDKIPPVVDSTYRHPGGIWNSGVKHLGWDEDPDVLQLCGILIAEISWTSEIFVDEDTTHFWMATGRCIKMNETYKKRLAKALTADRNYLHGRATEEDLRDFDQWVSHLESSPAGIITDLPADGDDTEKRATYFNQAMINNVAHRRFAFTGSSDLLAIVPNLSKAGDIIACVDAACAPYVLRHIEGDEYHFLGECYLENHMYGEAFEKQRLEKTPDTVFRIR